MYINKIEIKNFRNYEKQEIELNPHINIFYGDNAQGKTNILEAIFISGFGKSFRTSKEKEMIKLGEDFLEATVFYQKSDRDGKIRTVISNKKQIEVNGVKIKKLSELIGKINLVIFTPDDINILKGGPQNRRRFLDIMISQLKPNYMHNLNLYLKTLEQRNNYLKQIKEENKPESMLEIWDEKLAEYAEIICKYRTEFIGKLNSKIKEIHSEVTSNSEEIKIEYITECNNREIYLQLLKQRRKLDTIKGYTKTSKIRTKINKKTKSKINKSKTTIKITKIKIKINKNKINHSSNNHNNLKCRKRMHNKFSMRFNRTNEIHKKKSKKR